MPTPTPRKSVKSRKAPPGANPPTPSGVTPSSHALIATRAYELFLQRGGEHGRDQEDWLAAERELLASGIATTAGDLVH